MPERKVRSVLPASDRLNIANIVHGDADYKVFQVREKDIRRFCGGCDLHMGDNSCALLNDNLQAMAMMRGNCDFASIRLEQARMTRDGLLPRTRRSVEERPPIFLVPAPKVKKKNRERY